MFLYPGGPRGLVSQGPVPEKIEVAAGDGARGQAFQGVMMESLFQGMKNQRGHLPLGEEERQIHPGRDYAAPGPQVPGQKDLPRFQFDQAEGPFHFAGYLGDQGCSLRVIAHFDQEALGQAFEQPLGQ
jgi:hypothetical protein